MKQAVNRLNPLLKRPWWRRRQLEATERRHQADDLAAFDFIHSISCWPDDELIAWKHRWQGRHRYAVILLCFLYVLLPLDIVSDALPICGQADEMTAAVIGMRALFTR